VAAPDGQAQPGEVRLHLGYPSASDHCFTVLWPLAHGRLGQRHPDDSLQPGLLRSPVRRLRHESDVWRVHGVFHPWQWPGL